MQCNTYLYSTIPDSLVSKQMLKQALKMSHTLSSVSHFPHSDRSSVRNTWKKKQDNEGRGEWMGGNERGWEGRGKGEGSGWEGMREYHRAVVTVARRQMRVKYLSMASHNCTPYVNYSTLI